MGIDGIGSSVIIALAAVLWFLYLVPTWLKRREYLATERNAVRLQQTMRIMAESAELPGVVRVEATARSVAAQERALRKQQKLAGRGPFPEERAARLEENPRRSSSVPADPRRLSSAHSVRIETSPAARRLRRSRALASLVLLVSLVAGGFGISTIAETGSWVLLAASVVVGFGALALLGQAASVSRARSERARSAEASAVATLHDEAEYDVAPRPGWTPVPVPRPLYLSRSDAAGADARRLSGMRSDADARRSSSARSARIETSDYDHAAALLAAAAEAERALREAQGASEVTRIERPAPVAAPAAAPAAVQPSAPAASRFARMGILDEPDAAPADLDDILRRRRAVG